MNDLPTEENPTEGQDDLNITEKLEQGFNQILHPFQSFIQDEITGSILLLICTIIALVLANSDHAQAYQALIHTKIGLFAGDWRFEKSLHHWINDGLMSLFFFVLGLEIKREFLVGELKNPAQSVTVVASALGGMCVPALVYYGFNAGSIGVPGWGIPMATDTAFAVGILALLRKHVPPALSTFLVALAIIDDIGAILVIALFYTDTISTTHILLTFSIIIFLFICNLIGIRRPSFYLIIGIIAWLTALGSGVHASIIGILVAMTVPARPVHSPSWLLKQTRKLTHVIREREVKKADDETILADDKQHKAAELLRERAEQATTPLRRWEHALERPVVLFVLPIFALANAGIPFDMTTLVSQLANPVSLGVIMGLLLGKGLGITVFGWVAVHSGLGRLPAGMTLQHIPGIALLGGIGFTMSTFIATLGFAQDPQLLLIAKTGILVGSLVSGMAGYIWLRFFCRKFDA
ncbi:MAG: Na(+)/H(+) antiporter NhaA [marine bacterium B5-7]|nr:MAG: Na(+)/H(+) antiporter NhaA [marine bacterium B5-7]